MRARRNAAKYSSAQTACAASPEPAQAMNDGGASSGIGDVGLARNGVGPG